mmetsp:Transcript_3699/g.8374  ORF Transcript_3699/g.8374 Transcript_3699/m.8374 type:complete len:216 (-) Transcript_3699:645-1292(-)
MAPRRPSWDCPCAAARTTRSCRHSTPRSTWRLGWTVRRCVRACRPSSGRSRWSRCRTAPSRSAWPRVWPCTSATACAAATAPSAAASSCGGRRWRPRRRRWVSVRWSTSRPTPAPPRPPASCSASTASHAPAGARRTTIASPLCSRPAWSHASRSSACGSRPRRVARWRGQGCSWPAGCPRSTRRPSSSAASPLTRSRTPRASMQASRAAWASRC